MNIDVARLRNRKTGRASSWDTTGRNGDAWTIEAGETRVLADIQGPGCITHIWMTQDRHYRDCLLSITWDDAPQPSILVPLGDFFGLGHTMINSYQSLYFTASAHNANKFEQGCALNCYLPMPFKQRAVVALINESDQKHGQYFYIDYETLDAWEPDTGYLHAEFRRANPFGGWGNEITVNTPETNIVNKERMAWEDNYVILETSGRGHYLGCNLSVTNFGGAWWGEGGNWWGEGDDMIWVDGYKWPPDLHGTGSEDYLGQAWGMQRNAFLRNGSSLYERDTGGYQTSYVFHTENPVRFEREIKVTIEHGHGNHLANEMSSVAYWYAEQPAAAITPPSVAQRKPVLKDENGQWQIDPASRIPPREVPINEEMQRMKDQFAARQAENKPSQEG